MRVYILNEYYKNEYEIITNMIQVPGGHCLSDIMETT